MPGDVPAKTAGPPCPARLPATRWSASRGILGLFRASMSGIRTPGRECCVTWVVFCIEFKQEPRQVRVSCVWLIVAHDPYAKYNCVTDRTGTRGNGIAPPALGCSCAGEGPQKVRRCAVGQMCHRRQGWRWAALLAVCCQSCFAIIIRHASKNTTVSTEPGCP